MAIRMILASVASQPVGRVFGAINITWVGLKIVAKRKPDPAHFDWLTRRDEGSHVIVSGHYSGDFVGTVKYGGRELAIITDNNGVDHEICYMHPVEFIRLD